MTALSTSLAELTARLDPSAPELAAPVPSLPAPPVRNRLHLADLRSLPAWEIDPAAIWHQARQALAGRVHGAGTPLRNNLEKWLARTLEFARYDAKSYCQRSDATMGRACGFCRDTARKCRMFFEAAGVIEVVNVMRRMAIDGVSQLARAANAVLFPEAAPAPAPDDDAVAPAPAAPRSVLHRLGLFLRPLARWWHRPATAHARAPP